VYFISAIQSLLKSLLLNWPFSSARKTTGNSSPLLFMNARNPHRIFTSPSGGAWPQSWPASCIFSIEFDKSRKRCYPAAADKTSNCIARSCSLTGLPCVPARSATPIQTTDTRLTVYLPNQIRKFPASGNRTPLLSFANSPLSSPANSLSLAVNWTILHTVVKILQISICTAVQFYLCQGAIAYLEKWTAKYCSQLDIALRIIQHLQQTQ